VWFVKQYRNFSATPARTRASSSSSPDNDDDRAKGDGGIS